MTPRTKRTVLVVAIVAVLLVLVYFLRDIDFGHRYINTAGQIVFVSDRNSPGYTHIWIMNGDGTKARELTSGSENDLDPAFSPDGSQIAFVSDRGGQLQVFIMDADGQGQHAVTIGSDSKSDPKFSPDGSQIAFLTRGTLTTLDLSSNQTTPLLPATGSATSAATSDLANQAVPAVTDYWWQPASASGAQTHTLAAVQGSSSSDVKTVFIYPNPEKPYNYTDLTIISPNQVTSQSRPFQPQDAGQTIDMDGGGGFSSGTYHIMNVSQGTAILDQPCGSAGSKGGSGSLSIPTALPLVSGTNLTCAWSPDGNTLAVAAAGLQGAPGKSPSALLYFDPTGKQIRPPMIADAKGVIWPADPVFSADGTQIAFQVNKQVDADIHTIVALGITPIEAATPPAPLVKGQASWLRWSPDGAHLIYLMPQAADKDKQDIYSMNPDGTNPTNLTNGQGDNTQPEWSPAVPKAAAQ